MQINNRVLGDIIRRKEIAAINQDIAIVQLRMNRTNDPSMQLAYRKLLKILRRWKKWGY